MRTIFTRSLLVMSVMAMPLTTMLSQADDILEKKQKILAKKKNSITLDLINSTQGRFWPPSEASDANGDFIVIGRNLVEDDEGNVTPVPGSAVLVSKDTKPPLTEDGFIDVNDPLGAPYNVIRELDITEGSDDLDLVIHTQSFGPWITPSGAPRIPAEEDSLYNLNSDLIICPDLYPTESQRNSNFRRPRFPIHETPVLGFQGDQVQYDPDTGETLDPQTASNCPEQPCPGEDFVDNDRSTKPITLGDFIRAKGRLKITLTDWDKEQKAFTAALFNFRMKGLVPHGIYTTWAVRPRILEVERHPIDPLATPNVMIADERGRVNTTFRVENPFPDPATDERGFRLLGLSVVYHSDYQNWGACFSRFGPGVDMHVLFNTLAGGSFELNEDFITVPKR